MPKTRIRGIRAPRNSKVKRPVSCGFRRRKKRGHEHVLILLKNTKKQGVHRCKICKHHFISISNFWIGSAGKKLQKSLRNTIVY